MKHGSVCRRCRGGGPEAVVRRIYIILLALHPVRFRRRFAFEMLAIYDEASAHGSRLPLLADGVRSMVRQWVHPHQPKVVAAAPAGGGAPVFHSLDTPLPGRWHLLTAATLTLVLFSVLTTTIGRERWRPRVQPSVVPTYLNGLVLDWHATKPRRWPFDVIVQPAPSMRVDPPYSFGVLDRDGDLILSAAEVANAPAMLQTLDRDRYGSLSPPVPYLVLAVLDQDRDGIISSAEISRSAIMLRGFDVNRDGTLRMEEAFAAAEPRR
jgi:hypothetical protein